jgi:hypothetical protein
MHLRYALLNAALVTLISLGCDGGHVVNGFGTYGSGSLQGFVSRPDGSPVANIVVFASFGPDAFGHGIETDARGLYELESSSYQALDQPPFSDGVIPLTVNFVVAAP